MRVAVTSPDACRVSLLQCQIVLLTWVCILIIIMLISLAGKPLVCFTFQNLIMEELHGGAGWLW